MGWGGVSAGQLLIILLIVLMIFGTKRVKSLGTDLGGAIRSFRREFNSNEPTAAEHDAPQAGRGADKHLGYGSG